MVAREKKRRIRESVCTYLLIVPIREKKERKKKKKEELKVETIIASLEETIKPTKKYSRVAEKRGAKLEKVREISPGRTIARQFDN